MKKNGIEERNEQVYWRAIMRAEKIEYHSLEFYTEYVEWYVAFARSVVQCLTVGGPCLENTIACNFVSRAAVSLDGIMALWRVHDYQDCWVVHRCLLDRLFHLHSLSRTDSFKQFDDWSFLQQYNARNAVRSSPLYKDRIDTNFFRETEADKARAKALSASPPDWTKISPESEARDMNLLPLYKQGYDYASTLVHPMANDGQQDYATLLGNDSLWPDQTVVLNNSCLVGLLLLEEAMAGSDLRWHRLVQECKDEAFRALKTGSGEYLRLFAELERALPNANWCGLPRSEDRTPIAPPLPCEAGADEFSSSEERTKAHQNYPQATFKLNVCQAHLKVYGNRLRSTAQDGLEFIEEALRISPDSSAYLNTKGLLLSDGLAKYQEATACLKRALELEPDSIVIKQNIRDVEQQEQRTQKPKGCFGMLLVLAASGLGMYAALSILYVR